MEQARKNGAKRMRRSLQQVITGTQQAQQASDDGNEHEVINNHTLNFTGEFTRFGDVQGHKNAGSVDVAGRFHRLRKPPYPMAMSTATSVNFHARAVCKNNGSSERRSLQRELPVWRPRAMRLTDLQMAPPVKLASLALTAGSTAKRLVRNKDSEARADQSSCRTADGKI